MRAQPSRLTAGREQKVSRGPQLAYFSGITRQVVLISVEVIPSHYTRQTRPLRRRSHLNLLTLQLQP